MLISLRSFACAASLKQREDMNGCAVSVGGLGKGECKML